MCWNASIIKSIPSTIVRDWVHCWARYNYETEISEKGVATQIIWYNSQIGKEIPPPKVLIDKDIIYLGQFKKENENRLLRAHEFN